MRGIALGGLALALACGCNSDETAAEAPASAASGAPVAGAMCLEHGVLEALCTKCNPKLAAVFQAKGDWCGEHGFPESICPICHPELGGKPAADVSSDGAPADGMKVRLQGADTAGLAGIKSVAARASDRLKTLEVPARLVYDASRVALVNARSTGVVRSLRVDLGSSVKAGAALAVLQSPEVGGAASRLAAARARVSVAEKTHARERSLHEKNISAYQDVLAAERELEEAKAEAGVLEASVAAVGGGGPGGTYTLRAPISGVVTARHATVGSLVTPEEPLFQIVDTSVMWAELEVADSDLSLVATGQDVSLTLDGLDGTEVKGQVAWIASEIDMKTRTAVARVPLSNPKGALRANLYGVARIVVGGAPAAVVVPRMAVQQAKSAQVVFVRLSAAEYETRRVKVGALVGDSAELTAGVKPGEQVVTEGSFLLKTETLKESIGAGCCEADR